MNRAVLAVWTIGMTGYLMLTEVGLATDYTWVGGDGYWTNAANWSPSVVPGTSSDNSTIDSNRTVIIDMAVTNNKVILGSKANQASALIITNGGSLNGAMSIGNLGTGTLYVTSGYWDNGGTIAYAGEGVGSQGTIVQSGGTAGFYALNVGNEGTGIYRLSGGSLTYRNQLCIGFGRGGPIAGGGFFYQTGGTIQASAGSESLNLKIGDTSNTSIVPGYYEISGGLLNWRGWKSGSLKVGGTGAGTFKIIGANATAISGPHYTQNSNGVLQCMLSSSGITPINVNSNAGDNVDSGVAQLGGTLTVGLNGGIAMFRTNTTEYTLMGVKHAFSNDFATINNGIFTIAKGSTNLTATLDNGQNAFPAETLSYKSDRTLVATNRGWFVVSTNKIPATTFPMYLAVDTNGASKTISQLSDFIASGGYAVSNVAASGGFNVLLTLNTPSTASGVFAWDFSQFDPNLKVMRILFGPPLQGTAIIIR